LRLAASATGPAIGTGGMGGAFGVSVKLGMVGITDPATQIVK
jgi:hypothetical protein